MADGPTGRRWTRIFRPDARAEIDEELAFHIEERVRANVARGMGEAEARSEAEARLGALDGVRRECTALLRSERLGEARRHWMKVSSLDFRLGVRMLIRYPGLTVVGVLALAFAIWLGAGTFEFVSQALYPRVPLPDGERLVGVVVRDASTSRDHRQLLYDLSVWRQRSRTLTELSALRFLERNLVTSDGRGEPIEVAEIDAAGFGATRVSPLLGRTLVPADEVPGAPPVAVLGHDVWQARFAADPEVIGRTIRLGATRTTVVGVMPAGFGFPVAQSLWVPLRLDEATYAPGAGPPVRVFARLADGASRDEAQAELAAIMQRLAREHPDTHRHLRAEVLPFPESIFRLRGSIQTVGAIWSMNVLAILMVILICGNIALLMFARAATRESELLVRGALGASRSRIVMQLFAEALVLCGIAAALGLSAAGAGMRWTLHIIHVAILDGMRLPFWIEGRLSPATLLYAVGLTLFVATLTGVLPALKATGTGMGSRLRQATAGAGGFRFGGIWTLVIVLQVAVTVTFPVVAWFTRADMVRFDNVDIGIPTEQYLVVRSIHMDPGSGADGATDTTEAALQARYGDALGRLRDRLLRDAAVAGVTYAERLPLMYHPHRRIDVEGGGAPMTAQEIRGYGDPEVDGYRVSSAAVELNFFETLGIDLVAGRALHAADLADDATAVLVNETFVRRVLSGRNAIGQRFRYRFFEERRGDPAFEPDAEPWYEIVGVVGDAHPADERDFKAARIYHPTTPHQAASLAMAVRLRGDARGFAPELRRTAAAVDPSLRLYEVKPLATLMDVEVEFMGFWFRLLALVSGIALILSLAGIHAVMAYTVARRTREIGIRSALGAAPRRIILAVLRRPLVQVAAGVVFGALITGALLYAATGAFSANWMWMVGGYAVVMFGVCMLACVVPVRRLLQVEPTEALRADA